MNYLDYSIYYNAKRLDNQQLAERFVMPIQFEVAAKDAHTIMLGPRGSGKTTMLRMLQPSAIQFYNKVAPFRLRISLSYTGIFIGVDNKYYGKIQSKSGALSKRQTAERLSKAAYSTQCYISIIQHMYEESKSAFYWNNGLEVSYQWSIAKEKAFIETFRRIFEVTYDCFSFRSALEALRNRSSLLSRYYNRLASEIMQESELPEWVDDDPIAKIIELLQLFNDAIKKPERKWALLLDELELAPESITNSFIHSMRGADRRLLIKMTLSPSDLHTHISLTQDLPMPGNDYDTVSLTMPDDKSKQQFCDELWTKLIIGTKFSNLNLKSILGSGVLDHPTEFLYKNKHSVKNDSSFYSYLLDKFPNFLNSKKPPKKVSNEVVRKLSPIYVYRTVFQKGHSRTGSRSRKTLALTYTGYKSLITMTEGNPRWFYLFAGAILQELRENDLQGQLWQKAVIDQIRQAQIIDTICRRIAYRFQYIPQAAPYRSDSPYNLLDLIQELSKAIKQQFIAPFQFIDIINTFKISNNDEHLYPLLRQGLQSGCLVQVVSRRDELDGTQIFKSLNNQTLRLSYILAPIYGLPLRTGNSRTLKHYLPKGFTDAHYSLKLFNHED